MDFKRRTLGDNNVNDCNSLQHDGFSLQPSLDENLDQLMTFDYDELEGDDIAFKHGSENRSSH